MIKYIFLFIGILFLLFLSSLYFKSTRYGYDVTKNYRYRFAQKPHILPVKIEEDTIHIDQAPDGDTTTFLAITCKHTAAGNLLEPTIEIATRHRKLTATLERGAEGRRYLNISSLKLHPNDTLHLTPRYVTLRKDAQIITFANPETTGKKILVVAPHPDDAEIAAFAFYRAHHKMSYVVTVTAGDFGPPNNYGFLEPDPKKSYMLKAKLRIFNSVTTPLVGGIPPKRSLNLGYFDGTLREMFLHRAHPVASRATGITDRSLYTSRNLSPLAKKLSDRATWENLVRDMRIVLEEVRPDIIVTSSPFIDAHPDHQYSTVALLEALERSGMKAGKLLLYTNHLTLCEMFPYGSRGDTYPLPPHFDLHTYYDSVYSYNLSREEQNIKTLALDTMNDLRDNTHMRNDYYLIKNTLKRLLKVDFLGLDDESYFRRAVRENELFFVLDFREANRFRRLFLQHDTQSHHLLPH